MLNIVYVSLPPRVLPKILVRGQELGTAPRQMGRMPPETKHLFNHHLHQLYIVRTAIEKMRDTDIYSTEQTSQQDASKQAMGLKRNYTRS